MADLSITAADVKLVSGQTQTGVLAEAASAGDYLEFDATDQQWYLSTDQVANVPTALCLTSGVLGQTVALAVGRDTVIAVGSVLTAGMVYVVSPAVEGKIAPVSDLSVAGGDGLFIVGYAKSATELVLLSEFTGVTGAT